MILISNSFKTDNKKLTALYESAKNTLLGAVKAFGDYKIAVISPEADKITLDSGILSAETLARYDVAAAIECVKAFKVTQRADGRLASEIIKKHDGIFCDYSKLAGFAFCEEALSLFYMTKKKEFAYLDEFYEMLEKFDSYLWLTHDKNGNGCLEFLDVKETSEQALAERYLPTDRVNDVDEKFSPFPLEAALTAAFAYSLKKTLAEISETVGDGKAELYSGEAERIREKISYKFWSERNHICYDKSLKGDFIKAFTLETLFMMYHGALADDMAQRFVGEHLLNESEFFTVLPLPYLPVNSPCFENDNSLPYGGMVRGDSYCRAIKALEKYGFFSELTKIGERFVDTLSESAVFTELYDPFTGEPQKEKICADYVPTAAAAIEILARFYGVSIVFDSVVWGALGHCDESCSEFELKWGGDCYTLESEKDTASGFINEKLLFTVTSGVRVETNWFGDHPKVTNVTGKTLDCVFVYRDKTYSFTAEPNETKQF